MPAAASEIRRRARTGGAARILAGALACAALASQAAAGGHAAQPPAVGDAAPPLVAKAFGGEQIDVGALRGKVVLLNFWASWCGPCREEMPALDAMAREHAADGLVVVGLSADDPHDRADAQHVARQFSYPLGMLDDAATNGYGMPSALPLSYIIAADGRIAAVIRPRREGVVAVLRAAVEAALADASRPPPP